MERNWRLGDDLLSSDCILDGLTFDDVILAAHHTRVVNPETVKENLAKSQE